MLFIYVVTNPDVTVTFRTIISSVSEERRIEMFPLASAIAAISLVPVFFLLSSNEESDKDDDYNK